MKKTFSKLINAVSCIGANYQGYFRFRQHPEYFEFFRGIEFIYKFQLPIH